MDPELATLSAPGDGLLPGGLFRCNTVGEFRAMSPLPLHSQELIDRAVVNVGLERLAIVKTLISAGLTVSIPEWLSITEWYWEAQSQSGNAIEVMEPEARAENSLPDRIGNRLPIYCTLARFNFGIRELRQSERVGAPLDTTQVAMSTRRINERIEETTINGSDIQSAGLTVPGILNAPHAATYHYQSALPWDDPTKTGAGVVADVIAMMALLIANRMFGPWKLFVPTTYDLSINNDFKANSSLTIRQRLMQLSDGNGGNLTIQVADRLPANTTVLMQMTTDVMDVGIGQYPTAINWTDAAGMRFEHMILACMIPRVKSSYTGQSGICIGTPS